MFPYSNVISREWKWVSIIVRQLRLFCMSACNLQGALIENKWWHYSDLMFALIAFIPNDVEVVHKNKLAKAIQPNTHTHTPIQLTFVLVGWVIWLVIQFHGQWLSLEKWKLLCPGSQPLSRTTATQLIRNVSKVTAAHTLRHTVHKLCLTPTTMQQLFRPAKMLTNKKKIQENTAHKSLVQTLRGTHRSTTNCASSNSHNKMANKMPLFTSSPPPHPLHYTPRWGALQL